MNIHIANLNTNLIESDLQRMFSKFGEVGSVELVRDKLNNRSSGHGFIEMPVKAEGERAIAGLDGLQISGKRILVTEMVYDPAPHAQLSHSKKA